MVANLIIENYKKRESILFIKYDIVKYDKDNPIKYINMNKETFIAKYKPYYLNEFCMNEKTMSILRTLLEIDFLLDLLGQEKRRFYTV